MLSLPLDWEPPKSGAANPSSGMPKERQSSGFPAWFRDGHQEKCVWDSIILSKPFIAALFVSVIAAELLSLPPSLPAKDLARGRLNQFFIFIFLLCYGQESWGVKGDCREQNWDPIPCDPPESTTPTTLLGRTSPLCIICWQEFQG